MLVARKTSMGGVVGIMIEKQKAIAALLGAASLVAITSAPMAALAQNRPAETAVQQIDLPAGPLGGSLVAVSNAYGVNVLASEAAVAGKTAPAVSGALTIEQALDRLLSESGLSYNRSANGAYVIARLETAPTGEPAPSGFISDEIVVEGTKLGLTLQEATVSAEIFTSERIDREALFSLDDIVSRTPNVSTLNGNVNNVTIRGISRNGTAGAGQGQASNIYIDGAPASTTAVVGFQSLWDVGQVEVLRGPQSTLQGRNALAGAIFLQTKDPTYEWEAGARVRVAEFGTRQYAGVVSGPIIEDQFAIRLTADHQESDGFVTNAITGGEQDFRESLSLRTKSLIEPDAIDALSATVIFEYTDREAGGGSVINAPVAPDDPEFANFDFGDRETFTNVFSNDRKTYRTIGDVTYAFSDAVALRLIGTYEDATNVFVTNFIEDRMLTDRFQTVDLEDKTYTGEARLEFDFGKFSGLVGGYYFWNDSLIDSQSQIDLAAQTPFPVTPAGAIVLVNQITNSDTENYSFFTSLRYELNEKWSFDFGLRYDKENYSTQTEGFADVRAEPETCAITVPGILVGAPTPSVQISCVEVLQLAAPPPEPLQSEDFDVFLPRGSITYNISDDHSVFVGARRGYRAGGAFLQRGTNNLVLGVNTFAPEFLTSYEAGWRTQWLDGSLTFNGTAFLSKYRDQQIRIPGPSGTFGDVLIVNAAESTIYGLELTADYQVSEALNLFGSLGLLDTEFDDFPFVLPNAPEANLAGNEFENAPNVSFTVGGAYEHESGLFGDVSLNHQGPTESDIFNFGPDDLGLGLTERLGSVTTVNLRVGYRTDRFAINGYATNLFNDDTPTDIDFAGGGLATGTGGFVNNPAQGVRAPRIIGVMLDINL